MPLSDFFSSEARSLRDVLTNRKYTVHYYQREYRWHNRQITQLLDDLLSSFPYKEGDTLEDVLKYKPYFMGSIIEVAVLDKRAIIDGQQRLTSFTLLLLYFRNRQKRLGGQPEVDVDLLIQSSSYGPKSFNLQFDFDQGRVEVLKSLYEGIIPDNPQGDSAITMVNRYKDIAEKLDKELGDDEFSHFVLWITEKTGFIEIVTGSEQDAYKMFVTMNDRGLSLSSAEMLKGFVLSKITDKTERDDANKVWNEAMAKVKAIGGLAPDDPNNKMDMEFFQTFLRAKYAMEIRETKKGAEDKDYELLGSAFHEWMFQHASEIGLLNDNDAKDFIINKVPFFAKLYSRLVGYGTNLTKGFEELYYNVANDVSYQYMMIMAAVSEGDSDEEVDRKVKTVAYFLDYFASERRFNWKKANWNTNKYFLFRVMKQIRGVTGNQLGIILAKELKKIEASQGYSFDGVHNLTLNNANGWFFLYFLARFSSKLDMLMGKVNTFASYMNRDPERGVVYDREHILADRFDLYGQGFADEREFQYYRSRLGNLILLESSPNRSYQDENVQLKIKHYIKDNAFAASLNPDYYDKNPAFTKVSVKYGFKPYTSMTKDDIEARSTFYESFAKTIWNIDTLKDLCGGWNDDTDKALLAIASDGQTVIRKDAMSLEAWLERRTEYSVSLFEMVKAKFDSLGVTRVVKPDYVAFMDSRATNYFCELHCLANGLDIHIKAPRIEIKTDKVKNLGHWALNYSCRIESPEDIETCWEYIMDSLNQTIGR